MANKRYTCPFCGKIWYTPEDFKKCVNACADKEANREQAERVGAELTKLKETIEKEYATVAAKVADYNKKVNEYNNNFDTNRPTLWLPPALGYTAVYKGTPVSASLNGRTEAVKKENKDLSNLINSMFLNF